MTATLAPDRPSQGEAATWSIATTKPKSYATGFTKQAPTMIVACAASPSGPALVRSVDGHLAQAAIHAHDLGDGVSRLIRGKVDCGFGDLHGLAKPLDRNLLSKFFV